MFRNVSIGLIILCLAVVSFSTPRPAAAEVNEDYALKVSLERQLEQKLKQVIIEVTGTDRVVIFVNAELTSTKSSSEGGRGKILEKKKEDALVLPGVPVKKDIGTGQTETSELLLPGGAGAKYSVNRIFLSVWIDKNVPKSIVDLITDLAKSAIGYNQARGDQITIKSVDFERRKFYFSSLFMPPNLFTLLLSLAGAFLMVMVALFLMDPFKNLAGALRNIDWTSIRGSGEKTIIERTTEREIGGTGTMAAPGILEKEAPLFFGFVKERDLPSLAYLLKERPAQDAAVVANYIDPALATRLLEQLSKEKQLEVAIALGREDISIERVHALEEVVKKELNYVVGGDNKLLAILDIANDDVREKVLATLEKKDPQAAARLKLRLKSLENLIRDFSAHSIQSLYRSVDITLFAQVLKTLPADIQEKVVSSLSEGMAERLKEEMNLSRPLGEVRLKKERQNLMVVIRRLINEGIVEVESK